MLPSRVLVIFLFPHPSTQSPCPSFLLTGAPTSSSSSPSGPGDTLPLNPTAHYEQALLNLVSSFFVDDRNYIFSQAFIITLKHSYLWPEALCILAEDLCNDFLVHTSTFSTQCPTTLPPYTLSVNAPDDIVDFFAELLMRLHPARQLALLQHYLLSFFADMPRLPPLEFNTVSLIFWSLIPQVRSTLQVLRRINPAPPPIPSGQVFGPLTLADSPPSTISVDVTPPLHPEAPCPEAPHPCLVASSPSPPPSNPSHPSLITRVQTCRLVSGRRRHHQTSTWTPPRKSPSRVTFLLHRGLWNHAPWLDPLPSTFHPSSCASQAFLWLCPPRPRKPP